MKKRFVPSPAMVVALFAVMLASISPATAAVKKLIGTKDIKNGAVTTAKIKKGAVTKDRLASDALQPGPAGPKGDAGAQGPKGDTGAQGSPGAARAYALVNDDTSVAASKEGAVVRRPMGGPVGTYCIKFQNLDASVTNYVASVTINTLGSTTGVPADKMASATVVSLPTAISCQKDEYGVVTYQSDYNAGQVLSVADEGFVIIVP